MKKILFITHYTALYGANKSLLNLIDGLSERISPIVLVNEKKGDLIDELKSRNIKYYVIRFRNVAFVKDSFKQKVYFIVRAILYPLLNKYLLSGNLIKRIIQENNINIIHSNSSVFDFGYLLSRKFSLHHVWHLREFQNLDYNLDLINKKQYYRMLNDSINCLVAISEAIAKHFGVRDKAYIIYNGVLKQQDFYLQREKKDYFLFCGLLHENKGVEESIDAFCKFSTLVENTQLLIIGNTDNRSYISYLKNKIEKLGLQTRVQMLGHRKDIFSYMKSSLGLLMCSKNEAMGRVTAEALALGCPVIGYNSGATKELVKSGITGELYSSLEELVEKMVLIYNNKDHREELMLEAQKFALQNFSEDIYADKIYQLYNEM